MESRIFDLEADEGTSKPCRGSVHYKAERSCVGELANREQDYTNRSQGTAETDPELRAATGGFDGLGFDPRH